MDTEAELSDSWWERVKYYARLAIERWGKVWNFPFPFNMQTCTPTSWHLLLLQDVYNIAVNLLDLVSLERGLVVFIA
ncbi:hypothetical protein FD723_03705 [Nostoc sp. C052]|uniref:hypothetical protein n=1 Tax=Nostoc sp. C052 TaxID=2576902 RepID=UPI0015C2E212|nr:hypothetical protein [Nostoc sp. C052]QLE39678.1 hypothetical protein FD723_03705 [Nostoc sp. C052]